MSDERPGDLGEVPSDGMKRSGRRQACGLLACGALRAGGVVGAVGGRHGGEVEQAAQLGVALCTEPALAPAAARLAHAAVEADRGDDLENGAERVAQARTQSRQSQLRSGLLWARIRLFRRYDR